MSILGIITIRSNFWTQLQLLYKNDTQKNQMCCCLIDVFHECTFAKSEKIVMQAFHRLFNCSFKSRTVLHVFVSVYFRKGVLTLLPTGGGGEFYLKPP